MLTQEGLLKYADRIAKTLWVRLHPYNREIAEILNPRDIDTPIYRVSDAGVRLQSWIRDRITWSRATDATERPKLEAALAKLGNVRHDSPELAEAYRIRGRIALYEDAAKELDVINEDLKADIDRDHNQERRG